MLRLAPLLVSLSPCLLVCLLAAPLSAAEIYSNGIGGGSWSDAGTWRGGVVPGEADDVVIARDDTVIFDRNDESRTTCHALNLDPRAVLQFKTSAGPVTFMASGIIESYGTIKLDATKAAKDRHELRLVAESPDDRTLRIAKGGGLIVAGRAVFGKAKPNAAIRVKGPPPAKPADPAPDPTAIVMAAAGTTLDLHRAELENCYVQAELIDNTGAKPGERVNVVKNRFTGTSRLLMTSCDTPLVADNLFETDVAPRLQQAAIYLSSCSLAEVRGNTIRGTYAGGITLYGGPDPSVTNNLIENVPAACYFYGPNIMVRDLTIRDCDHGITMTSASGALEDVLVEKCASGYSHGGATAQLTNIVFRDMRPNKAYDIHYSSGPLTLLNCDIKPEQIQFAPGSPMPPADGKTQPPPVQSLSFLIVEAKGTVPGGAAIDVRTANPATPLPAGALDPNVRNAPAPLASSGLTPLPRTLEPLVVRGWSYDFAGKLVKAPEYQLRVLAPETAGQAERTVLKTVNVAPDETWYRANPNDKKPTVEVTLP